MKRFKDAHSLVHWLHQHGIDSSTWGQGESKTAVNLWQEIEMGEANLQTTPLRRSLAVVELVVHQDGLVLLELAQEMADGRIRYRNRLPSEKLKPGETAVAAAWRCLWEEIGLEAAQAQLLSPTPQAKTVIRDSASYPGLQTEYTTYRLETAVEGLPQRPFWQDNAAYRQGDPVRRHRWGWVTLDSLQI